MRAQDLMVGDWVQDHGTPYMVEEISAKGWIHLSDPVHHTRVQMASDYILDEVDGIPLTAEIFEANGFTRSKAFVEWKYEDDDIYMLWNPFPWIKIQHEDKNVMFPCEFVHELQHAMRLCGIDGTEYEIEVRVKTKKEGREQ